MGFLAPFAIVAGAAGQVASGISAAQQGRFNNKVFQQRAESTITANQYNQNVRQRQFERLVGQQEAAFAASGVEMQGSPLAVIADSEFEFRSEQSAIDWNAQVEAQRLRSAGQQAESAGYAQLGSSILNAAAWSFQANNLLNPGATTGAPGNFTQQFNQKYGVNF